MEIKCVGKWMDGKLGVSGVYEECDKGAQVIFQGNSLCSECYDDLMEELLKGKKKAPEGIFV